MGMDEWPGMYCQNIGLLFENFGVENPVRKSYQCNRSCCPIVAPVRNRCCLRFLGNSSRCSPAPLASHRLHSLAMRSIMSERGLQLALEADQSLPVHLSWCVKDGYLRATGWTDQAEVFTLGIWGPGEIVMPELLTHQPVELRALAPARVLEWNPDPAEHLCCSATHMQQMGMLLRLTRIRPAEARLFNLLIWLGERFGSATDQGRSVPLEAMNLTHRQLAEMASVSRVTVTKSLGHFRQQGWLQRVDELEVLTKTAITLFQGMR
ncbi:MAG: Crp/Fnr family transcriptional regulator [Cyanobacteria bacterium M_surface_10_m2_119]|nr:Crp/Fnr family transcriptional regulator [Cyanobacteria bacterium M_surface_10_m2_119]